MNAWNRLVTHGWPGTVFLLGLLVAWEGTARYHASPNFPGALTVLSTLWGNGPTLIKEMATSLWRAAAGLSLALVLMLPLGIFIGRVRTVVNGDQKARKSGCKGCWVQS